MRPLGAPPIFFMLKRVCVRLCGRRTKKRVHLEPRKEQKRRERERERERELLILPLFLKDVLLSWPFAFPSHIYCTRFDHARELEGGCGVWG